MTLTPGPLSDEQRAVAVAGIAKLIGMVNGWHWLLDARACANDALGFLGSGERARLSWDHELAQQLFTDAVVAYNRNPRPEDA
jgi:hypothetical protein